MILQQRHACGLSVTRVLLGCAGERRYVERHTYSLGANGRERGGRYCGSNLDIRGCHVAGSGSVRHLQPIGLQLSGLDDGWRHAVLFELALGSSGVPGLTRFLP